ncbi:unnamed protein product [Adineta steineri]|uniref:G-protein coupled receptors family 1 profile domain-containing protein n=1 Tax=Adineta steineri TaxID=433720 RepID=A0A815E994_9BILA|nr:unnamed protein product [Adineta steineri]CAF1313856.1 unnamed protein product [Adineta steineri]
MDQTMSILIIVEITLYVLIIVCSCIYLFPLLIIKRFHNPINSLTINVSVTILGCAIYLIIKYVLSAYYPDVYNANPNLCAFQQYIQTIVLCQVVYALCLVSIHRLCIIAYSQKRLLKTKKWAAIRIGIQSIFSIIISIPTICITEDECNNDIPLWFNIYQLIVIYAYTSTRRLASAQGTIAIIRNPSLSKRDTYVLKHMFFMFIVYVAGWAPIFFCIVLEPPWFNYLIFSFMQLLPQLSMLIDILDLIFYNHDLRNYLKRNILFIRRYVMNTIVIATCVQVHPT